MKLVQRLALGYIRTKFKLLSTISKKKAASKAFNLFCTPMKRNKKPLPPIFEKAEQLHFKMQGIEIKGWRWNHPASRKALVLHGFESSVVNFDRYVKPLIRKGYEVIAFDAPGHGRSGGKMITALLYKETIIKINEQYGPILSYMAHSFGGLAISLALEEMSHDSEWRLALIAPATETTSAIDSFFKVLELDRGTRSEFEKLILLTAGVNASWYSIRRALRNIRAKVLWIHDEEDSITPLRDVLKAKEENYPNVRFLITSGLGHRRIYRDNKVTKAIIDFL